MKQKLLTLATLLLCAVSGAWATDATITLSGSTTKASDRKIANALVPSIASSSAMITTGECGSSCANSGYYLNTNDGKNCMYEGTKYYIAHATYNNSKTNWKDAGLTNQYGTFTVPSGYTFKITKVTYAMACQSATFSAAIIVKDGASNAKYTSTDINVPSVGDGKTASATEIELAELEQVTLVAGSYTLNVNISSTNTSTGKYAGIAQVVLTGSLTEAAIDTNSPEITTDLSDDPYTAYLGVEKTLSIEANHVTGYQWYTCTDAEGNGASAIDGATNYVYSFTPNVVGTYYYKCIATNTNATGAQTATSKVATVNVQAQTPVFSLSSTEIIIGATAQIQVGSSANLDGLTMTDLTYDNTIVSITDDGVITGLAKGTTTITFNTAASGNYGAGTANLSITVTGKVVASSTPSSWTDAISRTWSVSKIAFGGQGEGGENGLYFKTGTSNSINYTSGDFFSLKSGNIMYLEVPSASTDGIVKIVSTQTNDRYLVITNSEGDQQLKMSTSGNTVRFDNNSIEEIDGKYYLKIAHGDGECKIVVNNFATITLVRNATIATSGYTSLASSYALDFANAIKEDAGDDALTAYYISNITKTSVTLTSVEQAPAGEGLILKGSAGKTYTIPAIASADAITNQLSGAVTATSVGANTTYALSGGKLKLFTGTEIPAGKAYLLKSKVPVSANELTLDFGEGSEATGIESVEKAEIELLNGDFFNLAGQRVAQPTKGLYVVNGKKVIIK